eukprot:CAMPEP_0119539938 /NCGR_PEP_ID=MMETSP1344-20130328/51961_1 /TAXON_ID=236787 /ORGANISM="Florenciella parvula, Strain CCMP2471" /LENGTH=54 /DNA_ID=CAMNT_0007583457 /DNA_START=402 /DNA_END=564 /DNA_ORIENTATION=+
MPANHLTPIPLSSSLSPFYISGFDRQAKEDSSFISKVYDAISIPVGGAMEAFQA